jgi:hypothetical protein
MCAMAVTVEGPASKLSGVCTSIFTCLPPCKDAASDVGWKLRVLQTCSAFWHCWRGLLY